MFHMTELASRLAKVKTIAIVGAKDVSGRPVDRVGRYLIAAGYHVCPVHPVRHDIWGLPTYATLAQIPDTVDLVNVFRASQFCPEHARECLEMSPRPSVFWMQLGIASPEARRMLESKGVFVVEDHCLMVERQRLFPNHVSQ